MKKGGKRWKTRCQRDVVGRKKGRGGESRDVVVCGSMKRHVMLFLCLQRSERRSGEMATTAGYSSKGKEENDTVTENRDEADERGSNPRRDGCSEEEEEVEGIIKEDEEGEIGIEKEVIPEEIAVEMKRVSGKRNYEGEENDGDQKRSKKKLVDAEEEGTYDIDSRYGEYLYERWMWGSMQENRFGFWDVSMWYWLAVLKEKLWHRYNIFYDADAIEEVYPENEVAGWVWEAFKAKKEPRVPWRDRELSFEWTNDWCGRQAPREVRTYEEELEVQARRRKYREGVFAWNLGAGVEMPKRPRIKRLTPEEEINFLAEKERFWSRRRIPCKAQHDAKEPNQLKWDARQEELRRTKEVREVG